MSAVLSDREVVFCTQLPNNSSVTAPFKVDISEFMSWSSSQIDPLSALSENWDGYGAIKPTQNVLLLAKLHLAYLGVNFAAESPMVSATRTGGVSLLWEELDSSFELEITDFQATYRYKSGTNRERESFATSEPSDKFVEACTKFFRKSD